MPSQRLSELAALLHMTALRHGQHADLIREHMGEHGEVLALGFEELATRLNEISDLIAEGRYD